jgi:hypothetical protein
VDILIGKKELLGMKSSGQSMYEMIASLLTGCKKYIDVEAYSKALAIIKNAKQFDHRNIYIIALENQVKLLSDLSRQELRDDFYKNQICSTIPDVIRCAINESRTRAGAGKNAHERKGSNGSEDTSRFENYGAGLKKLLNQILKSAEEFVHKADYNSALMELNRIYIIDPDNIRAKNLEKKIQTLLHTHKNDQNGERNHEYRWFSRLWSR